MSGSSCISETKITWNIFQNCVHNCRQLLLSSKVNLKGAAGPVMGKLTGFCNYLLEAIPVTLLWSKTWRNEHEQGQQTNLSDTASEEHN